MEIYQQIGFLLIILILLVIANEFAKLILRFLALLAKVFKYLLVAGLAFALLGYQEFPEFFRLVAHWIGRLMRFCWELIKDILAIQ
ncbi:MAG: hypothetical protein AAF242_08180 [Bacteroidota bacterium]